MVVYILESTTYLALFGLSYWLFFRKETSFGLNRTYLLATLLIALSLPLVPSLIHWQQGQTLFQAVLPSLTVSANATSIPESIGLFQHLGFLQLVLFIFLAGCLVHAIKFFLDCRQLYFLYHRGQLASDRDYNIVYIDELVAPFSFWNAVYISNQFKYSSSDLKNILNHESAHLRLYHGVDNLLFELLRIVLWWNPLFYFYRRMITEVHELQADHYAIQYTKRKDYGQFLLNFSTDLNYSSLANNIFKEPLKFRLIMMKKSINHVSSPIKYSLLLPLLLTTVFLHSCVEDNLLAQSETKLSQEGSNVKTITYTDTIITFDPTTKKESVQMVQNQEEVYKVVDEMPRFPGCEEYDGLERMECSKKKLMEYIYSNVKYPKSANAEGIEGTAVATFIIDKKGFVHSTDIKRDPGGGCGNEVLRVVNMMRDNVQWIPGVHKGKKVSVEFTLPVKFKLDDKKE